MDNSSTLHMNLILKKSLPFHIPLFWTFFIVKKRHHRNKYLGLLILINNFNNTYTKTTVWCLLTASNIFFAIFYYQNQKGPSNKFCPRNIFITMIPILYLYFIKTKKEETGTYNHSIYTLLIHYYTYFNKSFENTYFEGAI